MAALDLVVACDADGLVVARDGTLQRLGLDGSFSWQVEEEVYCVGRLEARGNGMAWVPCPDGVTGISPCRACFGPDRPECIFEPVCADNPSHCGCSFGARPHVVYLAFYGLLPKVGMTQARRVAERLAEQGADGYLVVQEVPDRATARALERLLARRHNLPEWRTHTETLPQLARPVPWPEMEARASDWAQRLAVPEARLLRVPPSIQQPLHAPPHRVAAPGRHAGTWLGGKGPYWFYTLPPSPGRLAVGHPSIAALQRNELVGRHIRV
jgi:hypothetical protein